MPAVEAKYQKPVESSMGDPASQEFRARKDEIDLYWKYYDGDQKLPLKIKKGQDENIILNHCGEAIDDLVDFFGDEPPTIQLPGGFDRQKQADGTLVETRSDEQVMLDEFWDDNDIEEFIINLGLSGFVSGHNYVRQLVFDDGAERYVRNALIDPRTIQVFWSENNYNAPLWYRLSWNNGDEARRQDIVPVNLPGVSDVVMGVDPEAKWLVIEYVQKKGSPNFEIADDGNAIDAWGYDFPPILDWKNGYAPYQYYGKSDLKSAVKLNDAINFVASNTGKIIKFHASPKTVITGTEGHEFVEAAPDSVYTMEAKDAKVTNLEMQSDLSSSMNYQDKLEASFFTKMGVVSMSNTKDKLGPMTNFTVRMVFLKTIKRTQRKQTTYGKAIAELSRRALVLMGVEDAVLPTVTWSDPLPVNRLELLTAAEKEQSIGTVSKQTLSEELGRDYTTEQVQIAEEDVKESERQTQDIVRRQQVGAI